MKQALFAAMAAFILLSCTISSCSSDSGRSPVIGLSPIGDSNDYHGSSRMVTSIFRAGGVPMILPMVRSESEAEALVAEIDGLVMVGGEDVNPSCYGEEILNETVSINGFRDTSDFHLIRAARKKGIPLLGICRGAQIINVAMGGSLYQDIPAQIGTHLPDGEHLHWIYIRQGTRLHELLGVDSIVTNSYHHQAVKAPAEGLIISAYAPDGVVEAYEGDGVFATQFHPEHFVSAGDNTFLPIFRNFISEAAGNRK